jgi:hypothetical protein
MVHTVNREIFANSGSITNLNSTKTFSFNAFSMKVLLQTLNLIATDSKTDRLSHNNFTVYIKVMEYRTSETNDAVLIRNIICVYFRLA